MNAVTTEDNYYWDDNLRQVTRHDRGNLAGTFPNYTGIDASTRQQKETFNFDETGNWNNTTAESRHFYYNNQWRAVEERVSGAVVAQYVWNPADRWDLIRRKRSVAGTLDETLFVLRDYLDPAAIIDVFGSVTERYRYDAFGPATVLAPDFSVRGTSECSWSFLYHTEFIDTLTGLYNYGFRFYHPNLGGWISRDPIGKRGGANLYGFIRNRPYSGVDCLGLEESTSDRIIREMKEERTVCDDRSADTTRFRMFLELIRK